jgi:hypothetical protein
MAGFHTKTFLTHDDYMTPFSAWDNIKQFIPKDKVIWEVSTEQEKVEHI